MEAMKLALLEKGDHAQSIRRVFDKNRSISKIALAKAQEKVTRRMTNNMEVDMY